MNDESEDIGLAIAGRAADASFSDRRIGASSHACPRPQPTPTAGTDWIEIVIVGEDDQPIVGERYQVKLVNGTTIEGRMGDTGTVRVEGIDAGVCKVYFPDLDREAWEHA